MKNKILKLVKYLLMFFYSLSTLFILISIFRLNVLKNSYFKLLSMFLVGICFILNYRLIKSKRSIAKKIIIIIIILLSIINIVGIKYTQNTIKFIDNVTKIKYEKQTYSVIVLNSNYKEISDLNDKKIGFLSTNINYDKTTKKLDKKIDFKDNKYEDIGSLIAGIYNNEVDAIVIDEAYLDIIEDNHINFYNESKVIYTFSINVKTKDIVKKVDINKDPFIIYISGSDSRTGVETTARSDVNIVAVVNPKENKILLISIPRDYYVQLHGTTGTKDKLTHAGVYGIEKSITTIEDLLDIDINYYTKVSFNTVINVVDVIDGIDIYSDKTFKPHTNKSCDIYEGDNHLNGECALAFARERYTYLSGDRHRGQNQQAVITAIVDKLSHNPKYLVKYKDILEAIDGSFVTDLTYDEITSLAKYQLSELKEWKVESISLDGTGSMESTYSMGNIKLYVMLPDESTIETAKTKINEYLNK